MSAEDIGAEEKFWGTPELVDMLFPFLDVASVLRLAQSNFSSEKDSLVLGVLQQALVWNKLIGRSLPENPNDSLEHLEDNLEIKKSTIECLTEILKMFKDPVSLEMDLLLLICKRFPPFNFCGKPQIVDVSHHLPPDQFSTGSVSPVGFALLESVESSLGSTVQKIERIQVFVLVEPWLTAVSERAARQGSKIGKLNCGSVRCSTQEDAEAFFTLVNHCQSWSVRFLVVRGEVGPIGWEALRKAVCSPGAAEPLQTVDAPLRVMIQARREDLRAIWETLSSHWTISFTDGDFEEVLVKEGPGEEDNNKTGWGRLEGLMDREKEKEEKEKEEKE